MAFTITDECIKCDVCPTECPNGAIAEIDDAYRIDPDLCSRCEGHADTPQCKDACPVSCIVG